MTPIHHLIIQGFNIYNFPVGCELTFYFIVPCNTPQPTVRPIERSSDRTLAMVSWNCSEWWNLSRKQQGVRHANLHKFSFCKQIEKEVRKCLHCFRGEWKFHWENRNCFGCVRSSSLTKNCLLEKSTYFEKLYLPKWAAVAEWLAWESHGLDSWVDKPQKMWKKFLTMVASPQIKSSYMRVFYLFSPKRLKS